MEVFGIAALVWVAASVAGFGFGVVVVVRVLRTIWRARFQRQPPRIEAPDDGGAHDYSWTPTPAHYAFVKYDPGLETVTPGGLEAQSDEWKAALADVGRRLRRRGVRRIVFVHGTFVGDDPLAWVQQWQSFLSSLDPQLALALRALTKQQIDRVLKDSGNFNAQYVDLVCEALGRKVEGELFIWSSMNHHIARLRAARNLVFDIAQNVEPKATEPLRFLLVGHSHAGQVFALVTHLLSGSRIGLQLRAVLFEGINEEERVRLNAALQTVAAVGLDFVTLGAPLRYGYCLHPERRRLLHLINHRGTEPKGGSWVGALHTRAGDYIQQWGVAGSDTTATTPHDQEINRRLDDVLDVGVERSLWLNNVRTNPRVHQDGFSLLIDYDDASTIKPNFLATGFGHAVYTTKRVLRFNLELIAKHLYAPPEADS